jgi:hypothetical protein
MWSRLVPSGSGWGNARRSMLNVADRSHGTARRSFRGATHCSRRRTGKACSGWKRPHTVAPFDRLIGRERGSDDCCRTPSRRRTSAMLHWICRDYTTITLRLLCCARCAWRTPTRCMVRVAAPTAARAGPRHAGTACRRVCYRVQPLVPRFVVGATRLRSRELATPA